MLKALAYYPILGKPLIVDLGLITAVFLIIAAYFGYAVLRHPEKFPVKRHLTFIKIALTFATLHIILAVAVYFF